MEVRTFSDNIVEELRREGFEENQLTTDEIQGIVDVVLERATEIFEAYTSKFQPGSAFRPYHFTDYIRGLKHDKDRARTNGVGGSDSSPV